MLTRTVLINCLPASPVNTRQIRYSMTMASQDTVASARTALQSIPNSMPLNSLPSIKSCGTRTVSSPRTVSSGYGPARWCLVFCSSPRLFHHDTKLRCHLPGPGTIYQLHRDPWLPLKKGRFRKTTFQKFKC